MSWSDLEFERVCAKAEVPPGTKKSFRVNGKDIVLINVGGYYFALQNLCTHEEGDLSVGELKGYTLKCPEHGAEFDVRSGAVLMGPDGDEPSSIAAASRFETSVRGDDVYIRA